MEPEQLLAELDKELKSVLSALASFKPATEDVSVTDASGQVEVVVKPSSELVRISVAPDWAKHMEVAALAPAIAETISKAQAKAFGLDMDDLGEPVESDAAEVQQLQDRLIAEKTDELFRPVSNDELQRKVDDLPGMLDRLEKFADEAVEKVQPDEADMPRDPAEFTPDESFGTTVTSENRMVSVRVMAGFVGEVAIKESWLAARSGIAVTECFDQIIEQLPDVVAAETRNLGGSA